MPDTVKQNADRIVDLPDYFPEMPRLIPHVEHYQSVCANWRYSRQKLLELRERLASQQAALTDVMTIAAAGSFGRLEASAQSDADCIIVLKDGLPDQSASERAAVDLVTSAIADMGISKPNPTGVFARARAFEELLPPQEAGGMGSSDEHVDVLGKRILMLLESRPVFADEAYVSCLEQVFARYGIYVGADTRKEHLYLLNHLIHYFRFICVNYQASFDREYERWPLRNLKLRHSRIVMYMGLLVLIGESSKYVCAQKIAILHEHLHLTPLERIAMVYEANHDWSFFRVAGLYNTFLARISDETTRQELNNLDYSGRYENVLFSTLKTNSDALQSELTRFVLARRGQWSERFFEYLIF